MNIDQGQMIYGTRSELYPDAVCWGIVISASCDLENEKIPFLYYVNAIPVEEYLMTERGFVRTFKTKKDSLIDRISRPNSKKPLNALLLIEWTEEEALHSIDSVEKNPDGTIHKSYHELNKLIQAESDKDMRKEFIRSNQKDVYGFIKNVDQSQPGHLYHLPNFECREQGIVETGVGYIIDMQDLNRLPIDCARIIIDNRGLDKQIYDLLDEDMKNRVSKNFCIDRDDPYVLIGDVIPSPRREHLLQGFSNSFIRIGINRITGRMIDQFTENMGERI